MIKPILLSAIESKQIMISKSMAIRRLISPQPCGKLVRTEINGNGLKKAWIFEDGKSYYCDYDNSNTTLWVKEPWARNGAAILYLADCLNTDKEITIKWIVAEHMPKWGSRISIATVGHKAQKIKSAILKDIENEGFSDTIGLRRNYDSKYPQQKNRSDSNPWTWIVYFEIINTRR